MNVIGKHASPLARARFGRDRQAEWTVKKSIPHLPLITFGYRRSIECVSWRPVQLRILAGNTAIQLDKGLMFTLIASFFATLALCAAIALALTIRRDRKISDLDRPLTITTLAKPQRCALLLVSPAQVAVIVHSGHPMIPRYQIDSVHTTELAAMLRFNELQSEGDHNDEQPV